MGRRRGRKTKHRRETKHKKTEQCIGGEELISKLPDDILVRVLSLLAPREVIRCGVLSRRWTTLPMLVPMTLKFVRKYVFPFPIEETKFIHEVNQVLDSYPGDTLTELSISYHVSKPNQTLDIYTQFDKWVQFAMTKKVKKFNFDFSNFVGGYPFQKYLFPPIPCDKKRLRCLPSSTSLTDLRLKCVNVTDEHIKHFLECCPFLESLCVIGSDSLTSLKVDGHIWLKFLEIQDCANLHVFEISAPNLISFKHMQPQVTSMPLKYAPQLNEMLVSGCFYDFLLDNFHVFASYFSQIEILSLGVQDYCKREFQCPNGIPTLRNLKNLTIHASITFAESLLCFGSWIEESPLLRRFVFKENVFRGTPNKKEKAVKPRICLHQLLKEVEFVGFKGDVLDTELVMYIIDNAVNLEKIIFDWRDPDSIGTPFEDYESKQRKNVVKVQTTKFKSMLSPAVEFVLVP